MRHVVHVDYVRAERARELSELVFQVMIVYQALPVEVGPLYDSPLRFVEIQIWAASEQPDDVPTLSLSPGQGVHIEFGSAAPFIKVVDL